MLLDVGLLGFNGTEWVKKGRVDALFSNAAVELRWHDILDPSTQVLVSNVGPSTVPNTSNRKRSKAVKAPRRFVGFYQVCLAPHT